MRLPDGDGLELVRHIAALAADLPVAVITAYGSAENAVAALKAGAFDYVSKPVGLEQLRALVQSALSLPERGASGAGAGASSCSARARRSRRCASMIGKLARTPGAGLHLRRVGQRQGARRAPDPRASARAASGRSSPVNCGAIPENLMESEFFGYSKGAFTGAADDRDGFFQAANGGTLFLDEVAELPLPMQVKLLRAIQEKRVRKVGATQEEPVDVRIISATHQNLGELVDAGRFRQDLFYRLNVIELRMPPLRECREDIPAICAERSSRAWRAQRGGAPAPRLRRRRSTSSRGYDSRATCASWRTSSSARSRSRGAAEIGAEDLRLAPPQLEAGDAAQRRRRAGRRLAARLPRRPRAQGDPARRSAKTGFNRTAAAQAARHHVPRSCATACSAWHPRGQADAA